MLMRSKASARIEQTRTIRGRVFKIGLVSGGHWWERIVPWFRGQLANRYARSLIKRDQKEAANG